MRRVLSAVLAGCASTALMWVLLGQLEAVKSPWNWIAAVLVGLAALVAAFLLVPARSSGVQVGSGKTFRRTGRVEIQESSIDADQDFSVSVDSDNKMREGAVVILGVEVGKASRSDV